MSSRDRSDARIQLVCVAAVVVLVMATWFSMTAVVPTLQSEWSLSRTSAAWLTMSVQVGFVTGALGSALLNLADRLQARWLIGSAAFVCAVSTAAVTLTDDVTVASVLRFGTGMALACVYPAALTVIVTWFNSARGLAVGVLIGALTLGSALPHLIADSNLRWRQVLLVAASCALLGSIVAITWVRGRPSAAVRAPFRPTYVLSLLRAPMPRLAIAGYAAHMWELYAMWTWLPGYVVASNLDRGDGVMPVGLTTFLAIGLSGFSGCLLAGRLGDAFGRERLAAAAMATSGISCLLAAAVFGLHPWLVLPVLLLWGFSVIADSGLFSASLSGVVADAYTGTALTLQTCIGFLVTVLSIHFTGWLSEYLGWPAATAALAVGPLLGVIAMLRLAALLRQRATEGVVTQSSK